MYGKKGYQELLDDIYDQGRTTLVFKAAVSYLESEYYQVARGLFQKATKLDRGNAAARFLFLYTSAFNCYFRNRFSDGADIRRGGPGDADGRAYGDGDLRAVSSGSPAGPRERDGAGRAAQGGKRTCLSMNTTVENCGDDFECIVFRTDEPVECPKCGNKSPKKKMSTFGFSTGAKMQVSVGLRLRLRLFGVLVLELLFLLITGLDDARRDRAAGHRPGRADRPGRYGAGRGLRGDRFLDPPLSARQDRKGYGLRSRRRPRQPPVAGRGVCSGTRPLSGGLRTAYGAPCHILRVDVRGYARKNGLSVQHAGRDIRYRYFEEVAAAHGYRKIAIAHNRDDQVETFLLRVVKGSGLSGLASIPIKRGRVIRPLLRAYRSEIAAFSARSLDSLPGRLVEPVGKVRAEFHTRPDSAAHGAAQPEVQGEGPFPSGATSRRSTPCSMVRRRLSWSGRG